MLLDDGPGNPTESGHRVTGSPGHPVTTRLGDLAHTRSGDKGNRSNIGVVARDAAAYAWLEPRLTESAVAEFLRPLGIGAVRRYELPRIHAFNFVIEHALAGGASRSLRLDTQGKALGTILLEMRWPAAASEPLSTGR